MAPSHVGVCELADFHRRR